MQLLTAHAQKWSQEAGACAACYDIVLTVMVFTKRYSNEGLWFAGHIGGKTRTYSIELDRVSLVVQMIFQVKARSRQLVNIT